MLPEKGCLNQTKKMKIYLVNYIGEESGITEAFTNKAKATTRHNQLKKEDSVQQLFDIEEMEFPITAKGMIEAIEYAAKNVYK